MNAGRIDWPAWQRASRIEPIHEIIERLVKGRVGPALDRPIEELEKIGD